MEIGKVNGRGCQEGVRTQAGFRENGHMGCKLGALVFCLTFLGSYNMGRRKSESISDLVSGNLATQEVDYE